MTVTSQTSKRHEGLGEFSSWMCAMISVERRLHLNIELDQDRHGLVPLPTSGFRRVFHNMTARGKMSGLSYALGNQQSQRISTIFLGQFGSLPILLRKMQVTMQTCTMSEMVQLACDVLCSSCVSQDQIRTAVFTVHAAECRQLKLQNPGSQNPGASCVCSSADTAVAV